MILPLTRVTYEWKLICTAHKSAETLAYRLFLKLRAARCCYCPSVDEDRYSYLKNVAVLIGEMIAAPLAFHATTTI
jgi:hypothetical protein